MRTIDRVIVSAMIFSMDKKILLGKKDPKKGGVYSDCWHMPGGGIEENENLHDALKREIAEEVGINISPYKIELIDNKGNGISERNLDTGERVICNMQFNDFKVIIDDQDAEDIIVKLQDDLVEYNWFEISELSKLKLTPPSKRLFELGLIKL